MSRVTTAMQDLTNAQASLEYARNRVSKCHDHVQDDRAYLASVSDPRNARSAKTIKKAQVGLRKWEENLADAQSTLQECTRSVDHARERLAREQALRDSTALPEELVQQISQGTRGSNCYNYGR